MHVSVSLAVRHWIACRGVFRIRCQTCCTTKRLDQLTMHALAYLSDVAKPHHLTQMHVNQLLSEHWQDILKSFSPSVSSKTV